MSARRLAVPTMPTVPSRLRPPGEQVRGGQASSPRSRTSASSRSDRCWPARSPRTRPTGSRCRTASAGRTDRGCRRRGPVARGSPAGPSPPRLAVIGLGGGEMIRGSLGLVISTAGEADRVGALATYFTADYVGVSLPVIGLGIALQYLSPRVVLLIFGTLVGVGFLAAAPVLAGAKTTVFSRAIVRPRRRAPRLIPPTGRAGTCRRGRSSPAPRPGSRAVRARR
jgi:hypothetical protein